VLEAKNITKRFGGLVALNNVTLTVRKGELLGLIGPNGSGKTTMFNVITGYYRPEGGRVYYNGQDITGLRPHKIVKMGIARTFQIPKPFGRLTVVENVMSAAMYGREEVPSRGEAKEIAMEWLEYVRLKDKVNVEAKSLNIVERKLMELARAFSTDPRLLLLDELVAGLNPSEMMEVVELVRRLVDEKGITTVMVEHVMKAVMTISDRVFVLHRGTKLAEGKPEEIARDPKVVEAYILETGRIALHGEAKKLLGMEEVKKAYLGI